MKQAEKDEIIKWADALTDDELETQYYDLVYDELGSQAEAMDEAGYDMADIREQEEYEKYIEEKTRIVEDLCEKRGIELWANAKSR